MTKLRPLTVTLTNGVEVIAKLYKGEAFAKTFANRTTADRAAIKHDGWVWQGLGRAFFVRLDNVEEDAA